MFLYPFALNIWLNTSTELNNISIHKVSREYLSANRHYSRDGNEIGCGIGGSLESLGKRTDLFSMLAKGCLAMSRDQLIELKAQMLANQLSTAQFGLLVTMMLAAQNGKNAALDLLDDWDEKTPSALSDMFPDAGEAQAAARIIDRQLGNLHHSIRKQIEKMPN